MLFPSPIWSLIISLILDLTFQIPIQNCSLQQHTLLSPPETSTLVHCFQFGSASLFLLELFLHSSPVAYWAPTDLGSSSLNVISFRLFIPFTGFSRQKCWSGLPFPCPMDHVLSELSTMTHSFIVKQGCDPFDQFDYFSVIVVFILSALWWMRIRSLWKLPDRLIVYFIVWARDAPIIDFMLTMIIYFLFQMKLEITLSTSIKTLCCDNDCIEFLFGRRMLIFIILNHPIPECVIILYIIPFARLFLCSHYIL